MAFHLQGVKPLSKPMLGYCQLEPYEQTSVKFLSKYKNFIRENACENLICETVDIKSWGR